MNAFQEHSLQSVEVGGPSMWEMQMRCRQGRQYTPKHYRSMGSAWLERVKAPQQATRPLSCG